MTDPAPTPRPDDPVDAAAAAPLEDTAAVSTAAEQATPSSDDTPDVAAADEEGPGGLAGVDERYVRPDADRLSPRMLDEIRAETTGATEAAFFDLDKTIIAKSSTLLLSRTLMRDGLIGPATLLKASYAQLVYQLVGADHERMEQSRNAMLELTRGWDAERVRRLVRDVMEDVISPLVHQEALDLFAEHRRRGRDIWVVSSSGEEVVKPFAAHLGIRNVIATRSGIDENGCYDGTLEFYAYERHKATAIRQVAEVRGYDLSASYAYSDSITDLPFLSAVGNPVAVNPDRELRAAAQAMGWETRDFASPVTMRTRLPEVPERSPKNLLVAAGIAAAAALLVAMARRED